METVERSFAGLDGVLTVSAGWESDGAAIMATPSASITRDLLQTALDEADAEFRVISVKKLP